MSAIRTKYFYYLVLLGCTTPAIYLLALHCTDNLGFNPFATLINTAGYTSLWLLLLTLALNPLRRWLMAIAIMLRSDYGKRISDWNFLIVLGKPLGISSFLYAALHTLFFLHYEVSWYWSELLYALTTRQFIIFGVLALGILCLLTITSNPWLKRILGSYWFYLHSLAYLAGIFILIHIWLGTKPVETRYYPEALLLLLLVLHRLILFSKRFYRADDINEEIFRK